MWAEFWQDWRQLQLLPFKSTDKLNQTAIYLMSMAFFFIHTKEQELRYLLNWHFTWLYLKWIWPVCFCPRLALFLQYLEAIQLTLQYNFHRLQTRHESKIHMKIIVLPFFLSTFCSFLTFGQIFILYSKDNMQNGVKLLFK